MEKYIIPLIIKYENIDKLLENNNDSLTPFETRISLSIEKLLLENFICIVGEPGIGKSRLINELKKQVPKESYTLCTAAQFNTESIPRNIKYCIIDALDEVEGNIFYKILQSIKQYKEDNPETKIFFTCRKHYVASYAKYFVSFNSLTFIELCRLEDKDVMEKVNGCSETTKVNVSKSPKLRELLSIPRYLTSFLEYDRQKGDCTSINEIFEYIISYSIQTAIEKHFNKACNENVKILTLRVLEKVAFIMEISRKDQVTRDELYTILDGIKGNMAKMLIANFDLLFFENRILKDTNGILQFENTELQEYLAAKELCRQDNIESVLYDVAIHKELKHIYPNWYDVIPHISYMEDKIHTFINVIKLIVSYESNLENASFEALLRYIDPSILNNQQKEELFSIILEHYLRVPTYVRWKIQILKLMQECYISSCNKGLMPFAINLNNIQLANICAILEVIVKGKHLDKTVSDFWTTEANTLMHTGKEENQQHALNLNNALQNKEEFIQLSKDYKNFTKDIKEKFCEITGYGKFTHRSVVDCWLDECFKSNPYALNAILCIEEPSTIYYAYNKIIEADKLYEFFNPKGSLIVCHELYLKKQFDIVWNIDIQYKLLISKIIAGFINNHLYTSHHYIDKIVKLILLEKESGTLFIQCFDREWDLKNVFRHFNDELIDVELISVLDKLLHDLNMEDWYVDNILITLVNKIRNDEAKKTSISQYITRYAETFYLWDKNSSEDVKMRLENPELMKSYQNLSDPNISMHIKYESAFKLSKHIEFMQQQATQPLVNIINFFFKNINLDEMTLEKKAENSFTLSTALIKIPDFVKVMIHLGYTELIKKYKVVLAKTLPIICCTSTNFNTREIRDYYKSIIGTINEEEKVELVAWWKSRKDDFMNISPESVFTCITDYGIDAFSYKLEMYIEDYINQPNNLNYKIAASEALELISKGYLNWNIEKYKEIFNILEDDSIESLKMQCNAIMIEKYQDTEAIKWRIEYFRNHVVKSLHNQTSEARIISFEESEMMSSNPLMFRCFMNIKENEKLNKQMFDLFDFALSLCVKPNTIEYSRYLLNQIYLFFINADDANYISYLRKKVEKFNATNVNYLVNSIMNNAEMIYLQKEKSSINKSIKQYNKCIEESHLEIRNNGDLRRYFTQIHSEVQKEIQDQGIYALVRQETLSEDFIQRELKNTIINKCCQMGLDIIQVDREVTLQDNKRTDLLIRYGMCNPIMIELKLLHNEEIQSKKKRQKYKEKFIQYTNATNACLSVFWVFDIHKKDSKITKFKELELEYKNLDNTLVLLTDCKCSSGFETGLPKPKKKNRKTMK